MTPDPVNDPVFQSPGSTSSEAQRALEMEARLPLTGWQQGVSQGLEYGLEAADSIRDRTIPTFSRGELPHYAGINTFMKAPLTPPQRGIRTTPQSKIANPKSPRPTPNPSLEGNWTIPTPKSLAPCTKPLTLPSA
jgi:agmatinase